MATGAGRLSLILLMGILIGAVSLPPSVTAESAASTRTVQGEIVAANLQTTPNVIVVKVMLPSKEEMIVGATVTPEATITRGKQRIGLAEIKSGESVTLTYIKSPDGLAAQSIHVRKSGD